MNDSNYDIPMNATIRQEYVKCGNPDCENMAHICMRSFNYFKLTCVSHEVGPTRLYLLILMC